MHPLGTVLDGRPLAAARIGIGISGLAVALEAWLIGTRVVDGHALSIPMWDWVPAPTHGSVLALFGVTAVASVCVVAGMLTRTMALVLALGLAAAPVLEQQAYSNHLTLCAWSALWLVFSRSDARWSLSARVFGARDVTMADQVLLMTQLTVAYAFTGLVKINPRFMSGEVIQDFSWWSIPDSLAAVMGTSAVVVELALAVGLWFRRTRWIALAGVGLHVAIPLTMVGSGTVTFSILVLSLYPLFFARPVSVSQETSAPQPRVAAQR